MENTQITYFGFFQLSTLIIDEQRDEMPPFVFVLVFVSKTGLKVKAQSIARAIIPDKIRKHIASCRIVLDLINRVFINYLSIYKFIIKNLSYNIGEKTLGIDCMKNILTPTLFIRNSRR